MSLKIPIFAVLYYLFLPLCSSAQQTVQFYGKAQLGLMHRSQADYGKASVGSFEVGAAYKMLRLVYGQRFGMHSIGQDQQLPFQTSSEILETVAIERPGTNTINQTSRLRSHYIAFQLTDPLRKNAYIGFGLARHRTPRQWVYRERALFAPSKWLIPKKTYNSILVQLGYSWEKVQFEWTLNPTTFENDFMTASALTVGYRVDFFSKKIKNLARDSSQTTPESPQNQKDIFHSIFRADVGYGQWIPLSRTENAGATTLDLGIQFALKKNLFIGTTILMNTTATGVNTGEKVMRGGISALDTASNPLAFTRGASVHIGYDITRSYPKSYFFTLGYGHFWVEQLEFDPDFNPVREPYFAAYQARIGVKAGLFANTLAIYIPTKGLRPFVEFQMRIGLDFFREEEE